MRLIFIRHAEPDYEHNTLTERGFAESRILANRVPKWDVERFFVSPLARTSLTAEPSLKAMGRTAEVLPWMREFSYGIHDPLTGAWQVPWDLMPQYWTNDPLLQDKNHYYENNVLQSAPEYEPAVHALRNGMDALLAEYGYYRKDGYYLTDDAVTNGDDERTLVFFGHLGANFEAIGYLLNIAPPVLKQAVYLAPTSICILNAEKRQHGDPNGWKAEGNAHSGAGSPAAFPGAMDAASARAAVSSESANTADARAVVSSGVIDAVDVGCSSRRRDLSEAAAQIDPASYWKDGTYADVTGRPGIAMFRAQVLGDVTHLLDAGQPLSESGSFAPVLNG